MPRDGLDSNLLLCTVPLGGVHVVPSENRESRYNMNKGRRVGQDILKWKKRSRARKRKFFDGYCVLNKKGGRELEGDEKGDKRRTSPCNLACELGRGGCGSIGDSNFYEKRKGGGS
jgi:hypothetical protein